MHGVEGVSRHLLEASEMRGLNVDRAIANPRDAGASGRVSEVHSTAIVPRMGFLLSLWLRYSHDHAEPRPLKMTVPLFRISTAEDVGSTHADGGKPGFEPTLGTARQLRLSRALANMSSAAAIDYPACAVYDGRPRSLVTGKWAGPREGTP